jgi:hypothetical protein
VRRARIFEKQGHTTEALKEYAIAMVIESNKGVEPMIIEGNITLREKVEAVNRQLAMKDAMQLFESNRHKDGRTDTYTADSVNP